MKEIEAIKKNKKNVFHEIHLISFMNAFGLGFSQVVAFFVNTFLASKLSLSEFGAIGLIRNILMYAPLYALGIPQAAIYKLPYYVVRKFSVARYYLNNLFYIRVISLIFLIVFFPFYKFNIPLNGVNIKGGWILISLAITSQGLSGFMLTYFRSFMKYYKIPVFRITYSILFLSLILTLVPKYRINGYLISLSSANLLIFTFFYIFDLKNIISVSINNCKIFGFRNFYRLYALAKIGFPIRLNTLIWSLYLTADLWVISFFLGNREAGLYSFLTLSTILFRVIPGVLIEIIVPKLTSKFNFVKKKREISAFLIDEGNYLFVSVSWLSFSLSSIFFYILTKFYLSKYQTVLTILPVILGGNIPGSLRHLTGDVLILLGKQKILFYANLVISIMVVSLDIIFALLFKSLLLIALSTSFGLTILGIFQYYYLNKNFFKLSHKVLYISVLSTVFITLINYALLVSNSTYNYVFFNTILSIMSLLIIFLKLKKFWDILENV